MSLLLKLANTYDCMTAFSAVMRSCSGLKSLLAPNAGSVELCAIFAAADLNIVWRCEGLVYVRGCCSRRRRRRSVQQARRRLLRCTRQDALDQDTSSCFTILMIQRRLSELSPFGFRGHLGKPADALEFKRSLELPLLLAAVIASLDVAISRPTDARDVEDANNTAQRHPLLDDHENCNNQLLVSLHRSMSGPNRLSSTAVPSSLSTIIVKAQPPW